MMLSWLLPVASAGLLGSVHCIGMCGGLVAVASDGAGDVKERALSQLTYQAARLISYTVLGATAGMLGRALDLAGRAAGLGQTAAIVAGTTMSLWGLVAMLRAAGVQLPLPRLSFPSHLSGWLGSAHRRPPVVRAALLGGASALLPCGFLYAFALAAAATGSMLGGAAVMAALWLGNLPALLGFGLLFGGAMSRLRRHLPFVSASAILLLGLLTLNSRVNLPAFAARMSFPALPGLEDAPAPGQLVPADCHPGEPAP